MAKFSWEGTTRAGEKRRGVMEAENRDIVEERLRGDGVMIKSVKKEGGFGDIQIRGRFPRLWGAERKCSCAAAIEVAGVAVFVARLPDGTRVEAEAQGLVTDANHERGHTERVHHVVHLTDARRRIGQQMVGLFM